MPNIPKDLDTLLDTALIVCNLWGTDWENWTHERIEHHKAAFRHSPNYKESKARIAAHIQQRESNLRKSRDKWHKLAKEAIRNV